MDRRPKCDKSKGEPPLPESDITSMGARDFHCNSTPRLVLSFDAVMRKGGIHCQSRLRPLPATHDLTAAGCGTSMQRHRLQSSGLFITSTNAQSWSTSMARGFMYTPLQTQMPAPLVLYHEASISSPFPPPPRNVTGASQFCLVDLFEAWPSLRSMITANDSCIDEYYRLAGRSELFERKLRIQSGKLLVRKIAALYHAAMALDVGTPLVWVDWDCAYAPEHGAQGVAHRFWQHVRAHDVTILPFRPKQLRGLRCKDELSTLDDPSYVIDTGVLGLRRGVEAVNFLWRLLRHYDGGAVQLVHSCLCCQQNSSAEHCTDSPGGHAPCREPWFAPNLFLDDLFAWTLHVHWEIRSERQLKVGWFGTGRRVKSATMGRTTHCIWDHKGWVSACPGANSATSSFDVLRLFRHFIASTGATSGPYSQVVRGKDARPQDAYMHLPKALVRKGSLMQRLRAANDANGEALHAEIARGVCAIPFRERRATQR